MTSTLLKVLYGVSAAMCYYSMYRAMCRMRPGNQYSASFTLIPGIAGFGVFPGINTVIAIACVVWMLRDFEPFDFGDMR